MRRSGSRTTRGSPTVPAGSSRGSTSSIGWGSTSSASRCAGTSRDGASGVRSRRGRPRVRLAPVDAVLRGLRRHGIQPLITLYGTPRWANGGRGPNWAPTAASVRRLRARGRHALLLGQAVGDLERAEPPQWLRPTSGDDVRPQAPEPRVRADPRGDRRCARRWRDDRAARGHRGGVSPVAWIRAMGSLRARLDAYAHHPTRAAAVETPWAPECRTCPTIAMADLERLVTRPQGLRPQADLAHRVRLPDEPPEASSASRPRSRRVRRERRAARDRSLRRHADLLPRPRRPAAEGWQSGFTTADGVNKPAYTASACLSCGRAERRTRRCSGGRSDRGTGQPARRGRPRRRWELGRRDAHWTNARRDALDHGAAPCRVRPVRLRSERDGATSLGSRLVRPGSGVATASRARLGSPADGPPRGTGRHPALRRHRRARRRLVRRRGGAHLRPHRPERRRARRRRSTSSRASTSRTRATCCSTASRSCKAARVQDRAARASRGRSRTSSSSARCPCSRTCSSERTAAGGRSGEKEALEILDVVGLRDRALFPAAALPYGIQKRVELARALVARAAAPPARRAGRRAQSRGGRGARRVHPEDPRRLRAHRAARRAPHEPRHEHLRRRERPELRAARSRTARRRRCRPTRP